jgi:hydrophobic/amphiphilic exporter-1 (mainly G- bacteria), HAE1 family
MPVTWQLPENALSRFSVRRRVTTIVVFATLLITGVVATQRIAHEYLPKEYEVPAFTILIPYRNSTPTEVEHLIARPLERVVRTMNHVKNVSTSSSSTGCRARVTFEGNIDAADSFKELRDGADRLIAELPNEIKRITISPRTEKFPVLFLVFEYDNSKADLSVVFEEQVRRPLERVRGVAAVNIGGVEAYRIEIALNSNRLDAHHVDARRLLTQLQQDNFAMSAGWITDRSRKLYVRCDARFTSVEELRSLPIDGHPELTLADVAEVRFQPPEPDYHSRVNGRSAVTVLVWKEADANAVAVGRHVRDVLEQDIMQRPQLAEFTMGTFFDEGKEISDSLDQLKSAGLWGGFFAVFVIFYFFRRILMTFVIAAAIPLSLMSAIIVMYFLGWTLNIVTMMGLIVGVGMVVDNSIVVTEAIFTRRANGEDAIHAAIHGASEVGLAITVSTLTTITVFLPIIFMSDHRTVSYLAGQLGMPIIFELVGSLVVALIFIPFFTSRVLRSASPAQPRAISWITNLYGRMLRITTTHRLESVVMVVMLFMTISIPINNVETTFGGGSLILRRLHFDFDMPDHYSPEVTDGIVRHYEDYLDSNRDWYGIDYLATSYWNGHAQIRAWLRSDMKEWYVMAWLRFQALFREGDAEAPTANEKYDDFHANAPGFVGVEVRSRRSMPNDKVDTDRAAITLYGYNTEKLLRLSDEVKRRLILISEISEVRSSVDDGSDQIHLRVMRDAAQRSGVSGTTVAQTVSNTVRGVSLTPLHLSERDVAVQFALQETDRRSLDQVLNFVVNNEDGQSMLLRSMVDVEISRSLTNVARHNGRTSLTLTAMTSQGDVYDLAGKITLALQDFEMPPGYQWSLAGRFVEFAEYETALFFIAMMSIVFVFLLMGILFESFILPLSVVVSIPYSIFGVYWCLYLTGKPLDITMTGIGIVILIGVVVNNAIVLVDLINRLRDDDTMDRLDAIIEAGRRRFRPILMTSGTTIVGLIPMALGNTKAMGSFPYDVLGVTLIGGLMASTLLTLFVVPLFYTLFDDLRHTVSRLMRMVFA